MMVSTAAWSGITRSKIEHCGIAALVFYPIINGVGVLLVLKVFRDLTDRINS
jgi:uncharacterized membrane-anchored protein YitT (DUF2179 family)